MWSSRVEHLDHPDYLILDLDPTETSYRNVCRVATEVQRLFKELGIFSLPKTSGKRGLHIYAPLKEHYTYDQVRELAYLLSLKINSSLPDLTSLERSPQDRKGKVYLDYLQNRRGATMAAPYSARPTLGALVSMPLSWAEVEKALPRDFTMKNVISRIKKSDHTYKQVLKKQSGLVIEGVLAKLTSPR